MSKVSLLINNLNWNNIKFSPKQEDFKNFEINKAIALNILYIPHNIENIEHSYKSKFNFTREQ